ncbi:MAG: hypothetical protein RBR43_10000 [Desulfuromonadaceae bacterium]|nr:hypothetical protein [Desulfuromonadaceae bacterium]
MKLQVDIAKIRLGISAAILAGLASYFGQPLIHGNEQAVNVIVTVFSVLAGFLVAIIAIVGDPVLLPPGTWRAAELERGKLNSRLVRHKWLFTLYLLTLGMVFFALLLKDGDPCLVLWLERGFLFSGVFAFVLSLALPGSLMKVQRERIDAVIEHRRNQDNVRDSSND